MHLRIQARRAELASDSCAEGRRHLTVALDELARTLDRLATLPGHRFASIFLAAVCELRSITASLTFTSHEDAADWAGIAATMVSLQLAVSVSTQAVRQRA